MDALTLILSALLGYLLGSLSFARIVTRLVSPQTDIQTIEIPLAPGSDQKYRFESMGATTASMALGGRVGCVIGLLDMLKVTLPVLAFRLLYPAQPYFLVAATAGMVGHNWPVFYRFKGGRGISAAYGGLLAIDPIGAVVAAFGGLALGLLVVRDFVVAYLAGLWLLIPWMAIVRQDLAYVLYAAALNALFMLSMIPDLKVYMKSRRMGVTDTQYVMQITPMGRGMLKIAERLKIPMR